MRFEEAPVAGSFGIAVAVEGVVRLLDAGEHAGFEVTAAQGVSFLPMVPLLLAFPAGAIWAPLVYVCIVSFAALWLAVMFGVAFFARRWMRKLLARGAELATPQHVLETQRAKRS